MNLQEFFTKYPKVALGFSGGVDSSFLLYAAHRYGADVKAIFVKSQFQPEFELADAKRLAQELGARMEILTADPLTDPVVAGNPKDRRYYCKKVIFSTILEAARRDGFDTILDGTNASDDAADRPGMKALGEMRVLSPLRLCGLTKEQIREASRRAGLFTWDKPAYACLATRIKTGELITKENLEATEKAEGILFSEGFTDFRIRNEKGTGKIQLKKDQISVFLKHENELLEKLKPYYKEIFLDREVTR